MKKAIVFFFVMLVALCACATPTPQIIKETVIVPGPTQVIEKMVTPTPVPPTAVPTIPVAKPVDTVVVAMAQEPDMLHPYIGSSLARSLVLRAIRSDCVVQNEKANWVPLACQSVPTLENGGAKFVGDGVDKHLEATFKFIPGLKWHDGTSVKASDAVFGWKLYMDPDYPAPDRSFVYKIFDVSAVDDSTYLVKFMSESQALAAVAGTLKGAVNFAAFKVDYGPDGMGFDLWKGRGPVVDPLYFTADYHLPEHILGKIKPKDQKDSDWAKKPILDGPFMVKEWIPKQQITLEAVPNHPLAPKLKTVVFRFFSDVNAELDALQKGAIDVATQIGFDVDAAPELDKLAVAGAYRVFYTPGYQWDHLELNMTKFPFDDVRVRQALAYGIDRQGMADKLAYGKAKVANSWVPDFHWAYDDKVTAKYPYDPVKAAQLLKDAGWDCKSLPCTKKFLEPISPRPTVVATNTPITGTVTPAATATIATREVIKRLEFRMTTTDRKDRQALATSIQADLKKLNIGTTLEILVGRLDEPCSGGVGGALYCRTFETSVFRWLSADDPDPSALYSCSNIPVRENGYNGQNYSGFCDKKFDELVGQAVTDPTIAISRDKSKAYYAEAQKIWTEKLPVIPLKSNVLVTVARVGLKGFGGTPAQSGETWNIHTWELTK